MWLIDFAGVLAAGLTFCKAADVRDQRTTKPTVIDPCAELRAALFSASRADRRALPGGTSRG